MRKSLIIMILLLIAGSYLLAIPYTLQGNKVNIPDAYILSHKMASISVALAPGITNNTEDGTNELFFNAIANVNLGLFDRGEVGFVLNSYGIPYMNFKVQAIKEGKTLPQLSLGLTNVFSPIRNGNYPNYQEGLVGSEDDLIKNSPYIVASKTAILVSNIRGLEYIELAGFLGWGLRRFKGEGSVAKYMNGFFVGVEFRPTRFLSLYSEVDGENLNGGINIHSRHFTYQLSIFRLEEALKFVLDEGSVNLGLNIVYTLDHFSEEKVTSKEDYYSYYKTISPLIERRVIVENVLPEEDASVYEELPMFEELQQLKRKRQDTEQELEKLKQILEEE